MTERKVKFISFGVKHGVPSGIDILLDARALPNPYWEESLKSHTGKDQDVIDYINSFPITKDTLGSLVTYISNTLEAIDVRDDNEYVIGICCTGGQHRSVFVAEYMCQYFSKYYHTSVFHRDSPELNK